MFDHFDLCVSFGFWRASTVTQSAWVVQWKQMRWIQRLFMCEARELRTANPADDLSVGCERVSLKLVPVCCHVVAVRRWTVEP